MADKFRNGVFLEEADRSDSGGTRADTVGGVPHSDTAEGEDGYAGARRFGKGIQAGRSR